MFKNLIARLRGAAPSGAGPAGAVPAAQDVRDADALVARGNALEDAGDTVQAEALYRQAVATAPGHARGHLNLGIVLAARGDAAGAAQAYDAVLAIDPQHPFGNYNAARLAFLGGDTARAEALVGAALRAKADFPQALVLQASILEARGRTAAAIHPLEAALRLEPDNAGAWMNLALANLALDRSDACQAAIDRTLALEPRNATGLAIASTLLRRTRFSHEALPLLRRALEIEPLHFTCRSDEAMLLNHVDGPTAEGIFARHREYGTLLEQAHPARFASFAGPRDPGRRLRIGYVSCDFQVHPVALFLLPVLERHDRGAVEVFCYSLGSKSDQITARIRGCDVHWRDGQALSDAALADLIHADGIDILVDLMGHTGRSRLGIFAHRPAPVQASWLGYLNTTGLTRIDYRLSDEGCDPPALSQPLHTERLVMLPDSQWCYRPFLPSEVDPVAPVERQGHVTFGSFNAAAKLTPATCRRWAQLLSRVPGSRLTIANVDDKGLRPAILGELAAAGLDTARVEFKARVDLDKLPELIGGVDIALDSFPYGGGTTTFDALWMGVPVVATVGQTPASRSAASILRAIGLDDWVAPSPDEFVEVAARHAGDHAAIAALRRSLRPTLLASPLTDEARFARNLEAAYRAMWRRYTAQPGD